MTDRRRDFRALVRDAPAQALLVTDEGELPTTLATLAEGEYSVEAVVRAAASAWSLDTPLLELHFDETQHDDEPAEAIPALVVFEAPPVGWSAPDGLRWQPLVRDARGIPDGLRGRVDELVSEWREAGPPPALRPAWARPGWRARADGWIEGRLAALGRPLRTAPVQFRHWGISALMHVDAAGGRVWFKAVFPAFGHEPAVTALLHDQFPGAVAPVLAIDVDHGWLLLADIGATFVVDDPDADAAAVGHLVTLQRSFVRRTHELRRVGCPQRPFDALAGALAAVLADPVALAWVDVTPERAGALVRWVGQAAAGVAAAGFPDTLVHGDFHPANVAIADGRPVIFDWSDAAVAHPLVDALTWATWFEDDPARGERAWHAFADAWSDVCPRVRLEALRPDLTGLAAAYHTVSYAGILAGLEPRYRPELADGLQQFFGLLDAAVPAT